MTDNRRKDIRYPFQSRVTVTMNDVILNGTECLNISSGGMCIAIDDRIDTFSDGMLIIVHKHNSEVIFFKADFIVSWNNRHMPDRSHIQIGISFKNLDPENEHMLDRLLSFRSLAAN